MEAIYTMGCIVSAFVMFSPVLLFFIAVTLTTVVPLGVTSLLGLIGLIIICRVGSRADQNNMCEEKVCGVKPQTKVKGKKLAVLKKSETLLTLHTIFGSTIKCFPTDTLGELVDLFMLKETEFEISEPTRDFERKLLLEVKNEVDNTWAQILVNKQTANNMLNNYDIKQGDCIKLSALENNEDADYMPIIVNSKEGNKDSFPGLLLDKESKKKEENGFCTLDETDGEKKIFYPSPSVGDDATSPNTKHQANYDEQSKLVFPLSLEDEKLEDEKEGKKYLLNEFLLNLDDTVSFEEPLELEDLQLGTSTQHNSEGGGSVIISTISSTNSE